MTSRSPSAPDISLPEAVPAAPGLELAAAPEGLQVAQRVVAAQRDVPAAAAVAAVGPALGHARLAAERQRAVAAPSGLDFYARAVGKHRRWVTIGAMDRVFLIAGASTGIGAATARQAAEAGYKLVLGARSQDKLDALAQEVGGIAVRCDVTEYADVEAMVERARAEYGRIDVVLANAGVGHPRGFESGDVEDAKQMVLINVFGIYATIRATAAALRATRGHLVITSSIAGRARARRQPLQRDQVRRHRDGRGRPPGLQRHRRAHHADLPRDGRDAGLQPRARGDAHGRRHRPRGACSRSSQPPHMDVNEILIRPTAQDS